jgi:uncharacterized protein
LVSFFVLAYAPTWPAWAPWYLSEAGIGPLRYDGERISTYVNAALMMGPTLSAFVVTGATEGRQGVLRLLRRIVLWRVGIRWYLIVLVGIPAIMLASALFMPEALASFRRRPCHPRSSCTSWPACSSSSPGDRSSRR